MRPTDVADFEVLLVGGRSGVGKTPVAYQVSEQWQAAGVAHCLIYVNTVSVLERAMIVRAMGRSTAVHGVLLTATDETVRRRLTGRKIGTALGAHLRRSATRRCTSTATPRTGSSASPLTDGLWPTSLPMWPVRPDGQQPHGRARSPAAGRRLLASPATIARSLIEKRRSKRVRVETSGRRARAGVDDERRGAGRRGFEVTSLTHPRATHARRAVRLRVRLRRQLDPPVRRRKEAHRPA